MKYQSKVDWWFYLVAIVFVSLSIFLFVSGFTTDKQGARMLLILMSILFVGISLLMIFPVIFSTYYVLRDSDIFIKCGLFSSTEIKYMDILSIEETRNPMSSAAPSLDRLGIAYKYKSNSRFRDGYVLISPKLKREFIHDILQRNPSIIFQPKE